MIQHVDELSTAMRQAPLERETLLHMYRTMVAIRRFEETVRELYHRALMLGLSHLYLGEEAVATGACAALRKGDYITSTHRGHGHCLAKGGKLDRMLAEILGRATGYCKGKGGSMHIADVALGILGANGVVGGGFGIASGAGLSIKLRGRDQVVVCFFGDGSTNQGSFHETANISALWKLPVIYVCENNLYGLSTPIANAVAVKNLTDRALAYGMPAVSVDGNDVIAVYRAVADAAEKARAGQGPSFIECLTYRHSGHHVGDAGDGKTYRTTEEMAAWKAKDPIPRFRAELLQWGVASEEDVRDIEQAVEQELERAIEFAKASPFPQLTEATTDVYV